MMMTKLDIQDDPSVGALQKFVWRVLPIILVLLGGGTVGYMIIEKASFLDSFYMVIITLSTVGYREVFALGPAGQIFTSILIVFGILTLAYAGRWIIENVVEASVHPMALQRKMEKKIEKFKDHFIICGYGRVGRQVAREFDLEKIPFVVVDQGEKAVTRARSHGVVTLEGDGTNDEILKSAGVERAKGVVVATGSDTDNVLITLTANSLNPKALIVSRANASTTVAKLQKAGADRVVSPHQIGAFRMATMATHPATVDFLDDILDARQTDLQIEEVVLPDDFKLNGKKISESFTRHDPGTVILVITKSNGDAIVNPIGDVILETNDKLLLMGTKVQMERARDVIYG